MTRSHKAAVIVAAAAVFVAVPAAALATHLFSDVQDGSTHAPGIQYMADSGITLGCGGGAYCPDDFLTRAQMGTFLFRSSGNDPQTPPSVNADMLDGRDSPEYLIRAIQSNGPMTAAPDSVAAVVATVNITAPAGGGALHMTGGASYAQITNVAFGFIWLDVDGSGTCTTTSEIASAAFWDTLNLLDSAQTSSTTAVAAGPHTVDLCTFNINVNAGEATTTSAAGLDVLWVPTGATGGAYPLGVGAGPTFESLQGKVAALLTAIKAQN